MNARRIRRAIALAATLAVPMGLSAAPANAVEGVTPVTCPAGGTKTQLSPGLLITPRVVETTVTERYTCTVLGDDGLLSSRSANAVVSLPPNESSCAAPLATPPATKTINWSTGQSSTLTGTTTITSTPAGSVITDRGTVTAGEFKGRPYVTVVEHPLLRPDQSTACLSEPGLTEREGTATLEIL